MVARSGSYPLVAQDGQQLRPHDGMPGAGPVAVLPASPCGDIDLEQVSGLFLREAEPRALAFKGGLKCAVLVHSLMAFNAAIASRSFET